MFVTTDSFYLLKLCYRQVIIPKAVKDEFTAKFPLPRGIIVRKLNLAQKARADSIGMHDGENEAIVLALDLMFPLIIDDTPPQAFAMKQRLDVYSSLEFVRAIYISCFIEREEYDQRLDAYDRSGRVRTSYLQWAMKATKMT